MKTNIKRFSKRSLAMLLSILMIVSAFFVMGTVTAYAGTNWNANIFFRVPDSWNLSTYPNVQAWAVQSSSASSGTKYAFLLGNMSVAGTTSNSRLYHAWVSANHGTWRTEYIAFTANTSNWGTGDFYISTCGKYTAPLNYGATNSSGAYLFSPSNASNNTASTNNTISGSYNETNRDVLKKNQDFYVYTNGASSATGGSVAVTAHYVNGSSFNGSSAIASSDITVNSSDSGAHEQYGGAVEGSKVTMTATAATGYDFDGYYTAATGGSLISSDASYSYYVFGAKSIYARFKPKTYTITYNKGANGTGTVASTTKTHGVNATLSSSTFTRSGYTQTGWSTTDGGSKAYNLGGTYSTNADATLYPYWTQNTHSVTRTAPSNGSLQLSKTSSTSGFGTSTLTVGEGEKFWVKATPNTGYKISALKVGGSTISAATGSTSAYTYEGTMGTSDVATSVTYAIQTFNVKKTETGASGGTVKVGSTTIGTSDTSVNYGTNYTVTVAAPDGYKVTEVSGITGTTTGLNTASVTITGVSITAAKTIAVTYVSAGTCAFDLSKSSTTLNIGGTDTFTATPNGYHSSGTISAESSDTDVATVSKDGNTYTVTAVAPGTATITVSCTDTGNTPSTFSVTVNSPSVSAFSYSTANATIGSSSVAPSITTTNPSNSSSLPSGWSIVYSITSGSDNATINSSTGVLSCRKAGSVTVKASLRYNNSEKASKTTTFTVSTPTVQFGNTAAVSLNIGGTTTRTATGSAVGTVTSDTITYISSATDKATVSSSGVITGVADGAATISATRTIVCDGKTTTCSTSTNIAVTVNAPTIAVGNKTGLKIGESYTPSPTLTNPSSTGSGWTVVYTKTTNNNVTTISDSEITGDKYDSGKKDTYKASYQYNGVEKASTTFTVQTADPTISFNSTAQTLNVGGTVTKAATGGNIGSGATGTISYSSSDTAVATVDSSGKVTALTPGSATITATYTVKISSTTKATKTASYNVTVNTPTVTMENKTVAKGDSVTFSATTSNPSGLTIEYAVNPAVANVSINSSTGVVTVEKACTASSATITASAKNSSGTVVATKNATLTIVDPQLVVKNGSTTLNSTSTVYMTKGGSDITLDTSATNFSDTLYFKSSNTSIATVGKTTGVIHAEAKGTTTITVANWDLDTRAVGDQSLTFTVNVSEADTYKYLYFTNGVGWSGVKAYLYGDGNNAGFPGEAMVKIGKNENNQDVYAIRYPATKNYTNVIISDASNNNNRVKIGDTSDLTLSSSENGFWCNEANNGADDKAGRWNCTIVKPQIQANDVTIDMGSTQTMTATVLTSGTPSTFNWSSGTKSIATTASTTTASNVITGVAPGTSTITVKAYAAKPSGWASIVTDGSADDYVAGTATATATVVAENKKVTFGAKKTDDGSTFTDLSDAVTAKYYDADTSGSGSSGSGSGSSGSSGSDPEPSGGPYYLHIGRQNDFVTNEAIKFTWNGSYYYAEYTVETANTDYPFVINTKNTALGDSDKSASSQAVTTRAANYDPDNIYNNVFNYLGDYDTYSGYGAFKIIAKNANTKIYITFASTSAGVVYRSSITSSSGSSGGSSGSSGTSGEGTTMTSPQSVPYGKVAVFTAEATKTVSDVTYHFAEWVDGSGNKLSSDNPYSITVTADKTVYARYYKVFKLSAFDSYEKEGSTVSFKTSPPKSITVKHGNDIYTYRYDGTALPGNPDSPDEGITKPQALPVASGGTYGQGNYIQYYAGDEITLHYSAMSSSEIFKGVFYNNSENYYVAKPTAEGFIAHDYTTEHTLYMNSAYYAIVPSGLPTTTVDNDDHTIKFTGTKDFKNIDVEMATKRKVYFSDYTNAVIGSKNTDDYYYDGEALSVTGDQLTVKAAGNATQTNSINKNNVKVYRADANGQPTGDPLDGYTIAYNSGSTAVENSGATDSTRYIIISGNMPSYDLYIDLGITSSYTIKLGSKIMSDSFENKTRLAQVANITIKEGSTTKLTAPNDADVTSTSTSVASSTALTLSSTFTGSWGDYYMFVGWYWGSDTAPDFDKGFISDKASLSYTPKKGGTIWAVGTRNLYINGSKYITGKDNNWYRENNVQKNLPMSYDAASGRYYWEISDTMFAAAGSNYKTWKEENSSATTEYGRYHTGDDQNLYWYSTDDKYHGKAFFQLFDQESGNANKTIWDQITYFVVDEPANGPTYGKVYPPEGTYTEKQHNGQGFINFNESGSYAGQSSPLRIYFDPKASGNARLTVESTKIYSNLYVSNGYTVGSTLKTSDVTVEPVVDGVVKTDGQSGYFSVGKQGTGWAPDVEGHVNHYKPQKKGATVRITKTAGGSDKIVAFFIYDITNKTVRAERDVKNSGSDYYIDLTLANSEQNLYIVPIVEEAGANVTISFDATQLNRKQWGDIVTAYAWYQNSGGDALGGYPGQPMIPSDDMSTWTTTFAATKGGNELAGITFSNYVDGAHSWLGCSGVMGSVSDHTTGTASGGIVNVYNHISSGTNGEYSRTNFKAQTYDYREPIPLYDRFKGSDNVSISFSMKDGNSSLLSWRHSELLNHNIVTLEPHPNWDKLNWEYLTNAKGDKYIDLNGNTMKTKPTASFYIAAKGQVVYNSSRMDYVFHGGHDYEMKGYSAEYSDPAGGAVRGSYSKTALSSGQWDSDITYGGKSGLDMKYAVQWYVYDAQGNYITTVLSAGIADLSSNNVDTYIAKELEDKGYAVDGKSVAICYDKPRYMYGDWSNVTNSANSINCGPNFDAYRFTGQWNAVASNELVKVNVGVGMMTDSGEVLASSNTAGYGNASASYDTTKGNNANVTNEDGDTAPFTASDNSFVRTAVRDAENSPVKLNASAQNFIGWYYYDANTGDFVKANYASNENFYPNYSNKDVTFYAMYRASAVYQYKYCGREGKADDTSTWRTYSASGEDLTATEMANYSKIDAASHEADIKNKVPVGIGIFKKNIDFTPTKYNTWTKTSDPNGYVLDITGFATTLPTYTLTVHYKDASGNPVTITDSAVYNDKAVNLTDLNGGAPVTSYYGKKFLGWYAYDNGTQGELISTQTNYGLRLTRDQAVIAVYDEDGKTSVPKDGLHVSIDENEVNKELTTSDTGVFYNDTIVRVRDGSNVRASAVPAGATVGVLVVCDNKTNETINNYNDTQLATLANSVASGKTKKTAKGLSITNMQTTTLTSFNRTDIAVRRDYKTSLGAKYCVYAYIKNRSNYTFSAVSDVKTYE